jgi:hypothetical protein
MYMFLQENHPNISWFDLAQYSYEWTQIVQTIS